ncbi:MAG: tRNA (N6-isopentenyl adenosine(37)-C2)-methylthiotransferase MiaB, partial [Muribaculaceae bacterium]|nr:tRNA (N6-isopentenyl adenosine(37)-C2)-methylthiotransferase MiaB [Muribaculaceae bacterium]
MPRRLFIETYGCQMNVADTEVVASVMQMAGYEMADDVADADAILLNTCAIRGNGGEKIVARLHCLAAMRRQRRAGS